MNCCGSKIPCTVHHIKLFYCNANVMSVRSDTTGEFLLFVLLKILKLVKKIYTQHLQKKTLMEIRKCLDKVAVSPNSIKQLLGVVLVHIRLETTNNNLLCSDSSLSKWTSTSSIRLTSSYHVNILASNSVKRCLCC